MQPSPSAKPPLQSNQGNALSLLRFKSSDLEDSSLVAISQDPRLKLDLSPELLREMRDLLPDQVFTADSDVIASKLSLLELYFANRCEQFMPSNNEILQKVDGALSSQEAAATLRDQVRTRRFMHAIDVAVKKLSEELPGEIQVIDAGCGPIPILAITAALMNPRVRCTAIELNEHSARLAVQLIRSLKLENQITVVHGDATSFTPSCQSNLLISETMDTGLFNEPIAGILGHLKKFQAKDGIIIPERIEVLASLVSDNQIDTGKFYKVRDNVHRAPLVDWERPDTSLIWETNQVLEKVRMQIDPSLHANLASGSELGYYLMLATRVHLFGDISLQPGDTSRGIAPDSLISKPTISESVEYAWFITKDELSSILEKEPRYLGIEYTPGESSRCIARVPRGVLLSYC